MPNTPLTDILKDFRAYRPGNHRAFLEWVRETAEIIGLKVYASRERSSAGMLAPCLPFFGTRSALSDVQLASFPFHPCFD